MLQFGRERSVGSSFAGIENMLSLSMVDVEFAELRLDLEFEIVVDEEAESAKLGLRK